MDAPAQKAFSPPDCSRINLTPECELRFFILPAISANISGSQALLAGCWKVMVAIAFSI